MVGSAGLLGGSVGVMRGLRVLKMKNFLNLKSFKNPVKRSDIITNLVTNVRETSAKCSTFGTYDLKYNKGLSQKKSFHFRMRRKQTFSFV